MALYVTAVDENSPAERFGLTVGCALLAIDGHPLNDALDYQFYTTPTSFSLEVCENEQHRTVQITKAEYEPLGCNFKTYLGDEKHSCANHCMFCFIDQLPPGMREPLYFKDDDERLSFLFGNYITLTNLTDHEIDRIIQMHISPIFVSVHTTNPALRVRMLANKRGGEVLDYLPRLAAGGIELNCQLVLCRGVNDGDELRRTLTDLLALRPQVGSIAAVPAGVTDYRKGLYKLTPYDKETAAATLDILEEFAQKCRAEYGRSVIYPSDEWYLTAERPLPPAEFYDAFAQLEDGVGMWRLYHDTFLEELENYTGLVMPHSMDVVTGTLAGPLIRECADALMQKYPQVKITVHEIKNEYFGGNVSVAGLVTGTDIIKQCSGKPVVLAVNKCDKVGEPPMELYDFYSLGLGELIPVSGVHGHGTGDLLDAVCAHLNFEEDEEDTDDRITVAVIGRPNVGKSSLINHILGENRLIVANEAGTTRDAIDTMVENKYGKFIFTDTAGLRKRGKVESGVERYSVLRSLAAVERSRVCVIMIDATVGFTEQDSKVAGYAHEQGKACIIAVNKWDAVEKDSYTMDAMRKKLEEDFSFMSYAPIVFISAKTGQRVDKLFETIHFVDVQNGTRVPTGALNEMLARATAKVQPPSDKGKRLKVFYVTQISTRPPTFVCFVNQKALFHFSYQRYLENQIRETFGLTGTPIKMITREHGDGAVKAGKV